MILVGHYDGSYLVTHLHQARAHAQQAMATYRNGKPPRPPSAPPARRRARAMPHLCLLAVAKRPLAEGARPRLLP
jgi:hypothetical protein